MISVFRVVKIKQTNLLRNLASFFPFGAIRCYVFSDICSDFISESFVRGIIIRR